MTDQVNAEVDLFDAVDDLTDEELARRVRSNAQALQFDLLDEHLDVIRTLVSRYRDVCKSQDCRAAGPHMRFLSSAYEEQGGSRYLYRLFDRGTSQADEGAPEGVITLIHTLANLPPLAHNEDAGFGTTI